MNDDNWSTSVKELFCYFHIKGKFISNEHGEVKYAGGSVKSKMIKEWLTIDEVRCMISELAGNDWSCCDIKYTVMYDDTLIDLDSEAEVRNLFDHNERKAHVYISWKGNVNEPVEMDVAEVEGRWLGLSEEIELSGIPLEENCELLLNDNGAEFLVEEGPLVTNSIMSSWVGSEDERHMIDMSYVKWQGVFTGVGQQFAHADEFRQAVYKFGIAHKFEHTFVRNSQERISVECKVEMCPWKICAVAVGKTGPMLRVTKFYKNHNHTAQDALNVVHKKRACLTASLIIDELRMHSDKRPSEIMKTVEREYGVKLTYKQAYRAKQKAMEELHGQPKHSYMLIPWICRRLKETDDKTVAEYRADRNRFSRVFIAYGACIEGFLGGARPILYVDGTHLSGPYRGTLLAASTYDADNELLPVAIAIVKGENTDDWTWFMEMIKKIVGSLQLTIVSDRHHAIITAIQAIFGGDRHAFCYRHIKENFSKELGKLNKGKRDAPSSSKEDVLSLLNKVAYARVDFKFEKAMERMHAHNAELCHWITSQGDVDRWAYSKFPYKRWDNITTNIAESFNAWMVSERKHTVSQLIHEHREKVARKMHASYEAMKKWQNSVGPNIEAKLKVNVDGCDDMWCQDYGGGRIRVNTSHGHHRVDLRMRQCSCAAWQMSGIPCKHTCAAVKHIHGNIYEYVEECYKITAQEKIYGRSMIPVVTIDMPNLNDYECYSRLVASGEELLQPPTTSPSSGRPKFKRVESQFQNRKIYLCSLCHQSGHTRRTCKNPNPNPS